MRYTTYHIRNTNKGVGMFGQDDNQQQQAGDDNPVMQAAMPDALGDNNSSVAPDNNSPVSNPTMSAPHIVTSSVPSDNPAAAGVADSAHPATPTADDLLSLKQQALQHLSPLVDQLDQTPEEKFRTTMMMIQASDDRTLIKAAFEAAQAITDDKARAQSLLDIINEINYFTQHQQ